MEFIEKFPISSFLGHPVVIGDNFCKGLAKMTEVIRTYAQHDSTDVQSHLQLTAGGLIIIHVHCAQNSKDLIKITITCLIKNN